MAKRIIGKRGSRQSGRAVSRAEISKLRDLGLVKKGQGKTAKSRIFLRQKFKDVLRGKASVVTVPRSEAKRARKSFKSVGNKIVVPRQKGERVRVDKSERITSTRTVAGQRVKKIVHLGGKMPKPRKGKKFMYAVPFANGGRVRFESFEDLQAFMQPYAEKSYKNWRDYMEIEEVDADEDEGDETE